MVVDSDLSADVLIDDSVDIVFDNTKSAEVLPDVSVESPADSSVSVAILVAVSTERAVLSDDTSIDVGITTLASVV
jgi:hypothetical protein